MSSPKEPKRRRLDDDTKSSAGVSFLAQDVPEKEPSKSKTEAADGDGADDGADLHAQLKAAVERRRKARAELEEMNERGAQAKDELERSIDDGKRELETSLSSPLGELNAKQEAARREMHTKHTAALRKLCAEHEAALKELSLRQDTEQKELIAGQRSALRELNAKGDADRRELNETQDAARRDLSAKHKASRGEYDRIWTPMLRNVQSCFENARNEEVLIRAEIRERGQIEPDSLLVVGNDGIAAVMHFLTAPELGQCEITCRAIKMLSQGSVQWEYFEKCQPVSNRSLASDARSRVTRYLIASKFAERLEPLVENHLTGVAWGNTRRCTECSAFPARLLVDPSPADYELFVRFSKETMSGHIVVLEGFVDYRLYDAPQPFSEDYPSKLTFNLDTLDLSSWPSMESVFRLNGGENDAGWRFSVEDALDELTATVVAVERSTSKAHLVVGSTDFYHVEVDDNAKITFYGRHNLAVIPHNYHRSPLYCLAFKWDDDRDADRKFECHVIHTINTIN